MSVSVALFNGPETRSGEDTSEIEGRKPLDY